MIEAEKRKHSNRASMSRRWRIIYAISIFLMLAPLLWGSGEHFLKTLEISMIALFFLNPLLIFVVEVSIIRQVGKSIRYKLQHETQIPHRSEGDDSWGWLVGTASEIIARNRHNILLLYVLRLVTFFWAMVFFHYAFLDWVVTGINLIDISFDLNALLSATVIFAVFLVLEMMLIVSIALCMNLAQRTRAYASWFAVGLRIGIPIVFAYFIVFLVNALPRGLGGEPWQTPTYSTEVHAGISGLMSVLCDNGFGWSIVNTELLIFSTPLDYSLFYLAEMFGIGLYLLWTWIMLRLAKRTLDQRLGKDKRKQKPKPQ